MLTLPTLLPDELLFSENPSRGGASSGEALRVFIERGRGVSSSGVGEVGEKIGCVISCGMS